MAHKPIFCPARENKVTEKGGGQSLKGIPGRLVSRISAFSNQVGTQRRPTHGLWRLILGKWRVFQGMIFQVEVAF